VILDIREYKRYIQIQIFPTKEKEILLCRKKRKPTITNSHPRGFLSNMSLAD
jgi:hypothetical protein